MSYQEALRRIEKEKETRTRKLDLSHLNLYEIPKALVQCDHIHYLNLSGNELSNISLLEELSNVLALSLSSNKISDISTLHKMYSLQKLNLSYNQIIDISSIKSLSNIQILYLPSNLIFNISSIINLSNIEELYLSENNILDISGLKNLNQLRKLHLYRNQISDISALQGLSNIEELHLYQNKISDISAIQNLSNIRKLYLSDNQISDISAIQNLSNIEKLELSDNQISDISAIQNLSNIQKLELSNNQISDISAIQNLLKIKELYLSENLLEKLPEWLLNCQIEIKYQKYRSGRAIYIGDNPIKSPPIEIIERGNDAIAKYFKELEEQGKDYLYEAKLLIVGDGGAGKTSLAGKIKSLDTPMPKEGADRTKGIDIQAMPIPNLKLSKPSFLMNVWDFGGQGYYHSTHQFFLTKRSLYVLLNNTRINKTDFNDWLQTISMFSDDSPVILIENEVGGVKSNLDLRGLQQHFSNILYVRTADISDPLDSNLTQLIEDIKMEIQRLPHIGTELPQQWVAIRKDIKEKAKENAYISDTDFYQICRDNKIEDDDAIRRLGDLFHDLGIFLHFRDDRVLKRIVILQNAWATKGVYTILDDTMVRDNNGKFTAEEAEKIWQHTPFAGMQDELISLMEKFKLCYRIPFSAPTAYISPNLLPVEHPDTQWDYNQNLVIYYDYDYMPKGILGMLIVELHRYVKDIRNLAWRSGCIFHHQNTDAQVVETYGKKKLEIRIKGPHCVVLSSIIISEVDKLNDSFPRIKVKKLIPCPCSDCAKSTEPPKYYEYPDLMRRKERGKATAECPLTYKDVSISDILEATYDERHLIHRTIPELIKEGKTKEAIEALEENNSEQGILLMARYNDINRQYSNGAMTEEVRSAKMQQINDSIMTQYNMES